MFEILEYGEHIGIIAETYQEALEYIHLRTGWLDIAEGVQYNEDIHSWETVDMPRFISRVDHKRFDIIEVIPVAEELKTLKNPQRIIEYIEMFITRIKQLDKTVYNTDTLKVINEILKTAEISLEKCNLDKNNRIHCNKIYMDLIYKIRAFTWDGEMED